MQSKKPRYVMLTIDTEFSTHKDLIGVWGKVGEQEYGISKIVEICDHFDVPATFFLDVYQKENAVRKAGEYILKHGYDVQLHTHPNWKYERKRENLRYYSLEEQCEIIRFGKEAMASWFGKIPVAHRAGDFGVNADSITALRENNILGDFSFFHHWPECHLQKKVKVRNKISKINDVWEVPVTCFFSSGLEISKCFRLIDINEPFSLLCYLFNQLKKLDFKTIVIVLHSFSFLGYNDFPVNGIPNREIYWPKPLVVQKFAKLLNFLKNDTSFKMISVKDFLVQVRKNPESVANPDLIPALPLRYSWLRLASRICTAGYDRLFRIPYFLPKRIK